MLLIIAGIIVVILVIMMLDRSFYQVQVTDEVEANIEDVWRILAEEYDNIHQYSEHVDAVEILSEDDFGMDCVRKCTLTDGGFMQEKITAYDPFKKLEITIEDSSMPMVPGTRVIFELEDQGNSVKVTATGLYRIKFMGPFSPMIAKAKYTELIQYLIEIVKLNT